MAAALAASFKRLGLVRFARAEPAIATVDEHRLHQLLEANEFFGVQYSNRPYVDDLEADNPGAHDPPEATDADQ